MYHSEGLGKNPQLPLLAKQLVRWEKAQLTPEQHREVERLKGQVIRLGQVIQELLTLAVTLQEHPIEKVLGKRDMEVAFDVLSRKLKL